MQDLLFEFVKDPTSLPSKGCPEYGTGADGGGRLARFGADAQACRLWLVMRLMGLAILRESSTILRLDIRVQG
jgi:hypothetical protein